jgi:CelD/BcsL family acetyltransferase involved in cellulose biosynthesis
MKYQTITEFDQISEKTWDQALKNSGIGSPFLRYGFQRSWWSHLGGGEWQAGNLSIITAEEDGELIGIAPLFTTEVEGEKQIHFIGSLEICDYLDFIIPADRANEFIQNALRIAAVEADASAGRIILYNISDHSATIPALEQFGKNDDWSVQIEKAYHTPAIALPDDWDTYLMNIDKKQRHEIRRKIRRTEGSEEDHVAWHMVGKEDDLDQAITDFVGLMENDPDKARFLSPEMRAQMDDIIRWAAQSDILQLSFLTVNEKNAAAYLCFNHAGRIWVYNSGFSPGFGYYSPGWVLLGYLIQHAIENGNTHFDFMRGDEEYKYRFGAEDSFVMKSIITREQP